MDLDSSPNKSFEDMKDDGFGFGFVGKRSAELDLNLAATKDEEGDEEHARNDSDSWDRDQRTTHMMDLNLLEHRKSPESYAEIGAGFRSTGRSESPPLNPRVGSSVPMDDEIGSDHLGKSLTERKNSDHRSGSFDYDSDRSQSREDRKSQEGDETGKAQFDQFSGKPTSVVNPDGYPEEMVRENTDLLERKSSLGAKSEHLEEETVQENPDQFSEKLAFAPATESADEEMEITHDHRLGRLPSPAITKDSDDETNNEHFYSGKSGYPVNNRDMEGENSYLQSPGRTPKRLASPVRRQMSVSPERSPYESRSSGQKPVSPAKEFQEPGSYEVQGLQLPDPDLSKSPTTKYSSPLPGSSRQNLSPSPKRDPSKDYLRPHDSLHSKRQLSPSARRSSRSPERSPPHDDRQRNGSPRSHSSPSPRRRSSPPRGHGSYGRSASRSPVRRRDAHSGSRRGYRERSRSRSPYPRDQYRRSPRRRYSPRRRSSPPRYHSRYRSPRRRPWSPPPNRSTGVGKPGNNLFIAGFSFVTTERDLERKFSRFGRVTDVRVVRDKRSGDSRGFGFISLERDEDADAAIRALDQTEWNGRVVLVEKSKTASR